MGTIVVTASGFSVASQGSPNGTKSVTVSDADMQALLNWAQSNYASVLPVLPTAVQILLAWITGFYTATINSVRQFQTPAPVVPAPITINQILFAAVAAKMLNNEEADRRSIFGLKHGE